jgi:hypothetical protein
LICITSVLFSRAASISDWLLRRQPLLERACRKEELIASSF